MNPWSGELLVNSQTQKLEPPLGARRIWSAGAKALRDLSRIPVNKHINSTLRWANYNDLYETTHPSLWIISLCLFNGAESGKVFKALNNVQRGSLSSLGYAESVSITWYFVNYLSDRCKQETTSSSYWTSLTVILRHSWGFSSWVTCGFCCSFFSFAFLVFFVFVPFSVDSLRSWVEKNRVPQLGLDRPRVLEQSIDPESWSLLVSGWSPREIGHGEFSTQKSCDTWKSTK